MSKCRYCGQAMRGARRATKEHIIPKSLGGQKGQNLIRVCLPCNEARQNMTPDQLRALAAELHAMALHHIGMAKEIDQLVRERGLPAPWL